MDPMDVYQQAVGLNNDSVDALIEGNEQIAVQCLAKSIKLLKLAFTACGENQPVSSKTCEFPLQRLSSNQSGTVLNSSSTGTNNKFTVRLPGSQQHDQSFIFNEAFVIPNNDGLLRTEDLHVVTAAVIFNLALTHHLMGSKGLSNSLNKADKLYSMVLQLLGGSLGSGQPLAALVKLVSINNLAQIRFDSGDYEQAREGLSHLSTLIHPNSSITTNRSVTDLPIFQDPEVKGLFMNMLLLKVPQVAPAA